ncbi:hypothetical protein DIPPA_24764 [Diplonema papillatum]|nr:hypothetical protein DIPPA_24764 [Diplonema papillatum]|eukprot:gene8961-13874_t
MSILESAFEDEADNIMEDLHRVDGVLRERGGRAMGDLASSDFNIDEPPIIPFNLTATQGVSLQQDDGEEELFDISQDMLNGLKEECGGYIDNLEHSLASCFRRENSKTRRRLKETSNIPLSFLYMRTIQAALKQTGQLNIQREKRILFNLQDLFEINE